VIYAHVYTVALHCLQCGDLKLSRLLLNIITRVHRHVSFCGR